MQMAQVSSAGAMCRSSGALTSNSFSSSLLVESKLPLCLTSQAPAAANSTLVVCSKGKDKNESGGESQKKQSLFTSITDALDFSQVRSNKDAELLDDARAATQAGEQMSREQYAALRRKIGGTYRDFFKDSVEVDGEYVEDGWVDKTCRICKRDTSNAARTVDKFGRYAHVECLESEGKSGNFFTRLFSR
ncbi:hypothetical protein O6H91_01G082400 [Diphasiastrum complanatum]|uniref:Uncharacterized protein n=1 Tax=Diphasiastrum complanatum TaxID=34168 RepID=A0ACC2ESV6_DIPCM|nr:hypothetical protein O6H91_01G082400 [Diphasiastrum complanatum]